MKNNVICKFWRMQLKRFRVEMDVDKMNEIKACRATGFAFNGIDEHVALVYHLVQKRIPAAFLPESSKPPRGEHF